MNETQDHLATRPRLLRALAAASAGAVLAFAISFLLPTTYEATATLLVTPLQTEQRLSTKTERGAASLRDRMNEAQEAETTTQTTLPGMRFSIPDLLRYLELPDVRGPVVDAVREETGFAVHSMNAAGELLTRTRDDVIYQQLIALRCTAASPRAAARAANQWAEASIAALQALREKRMAEVDAFIAQSQATMPTNLESTELHEALAKARNRALLDIPLLASVSEAQPPTNPTGPRRAMLALAGAFLAALCILLYDLTGGLRYARRQETG